MELWIRSQDKLTLMKTTYVYVAREEVCAYDENKCWSTIGVYETQERALEVLDEIQNILSPKMFLKKGIITGSFNNQIFKNSDKVEIQELSTYVYEMPED